MSEHWQKRQIDKGNYLIVDDTGNMIAITDARYVDLILAAPVMLHALLAALAGDMTEMAAAVGMAQGEKA